MQEQISKKVVPRCSPDILRLTWLEKEELCKAWHRSGLSKQGFCAQKNINISTFAGWCSRFNSETPQLSGNLLCPINITDIKVSMPIAEPIVLEISFPNAITAKVKATVGQFSHLLREIMHATAVIR